MRPPTALLTLAAVLGACAPAPPAGGSPPPVTPTAAVAPSPPASAPRATATPGPTPIALPLCDPGAPAAPAIALCLDGVLLHADAAIPRHEIAEIAAQVAEDVAAVQREFAWTLREPAVIHVLADRERYVAGVRRLFGYGDLTAEFVADNSVAFFEPSVRVIAVNWDAVRERRPIAAIRHELTHVVAAEACAPRCGLVPAWLNEGQARLAEALIPGAEWRIVRVRYEAGSMAATGTLLPLGTLVTQLQWNSLVDWIGYYKYQQAARVTELLREDIGAAAMARLYARIRAGESVARAYMSLTGGSFEAFERSLPDRMTAALPSARGIVTVVPGADGTGASYLLYGFPPDAAVTLRIRSRHVDDTQELVVSPQGAHFGSIEGTAPPGVYTITAVAGELTANTTVSKRDGRIMRAPEH